MGGVSDGTGIVRIDPTLGPYLGKLRERYAYFRSALERIEQTGGLLGPISTGHHYFGFNRGEREGERGVWYREWAPGARGLFLIGDFNRWDRERCPLVRDQWGVWSIFLPDERYENTLYHGSRVKVMVVQGNELRRDRIPAYVRRAIQESDLQFVGQYWEPPRPYRFQHARPALRGGLRIYEAHVGMAQEGHKVGSYDEFRENVLPRIAKLGYNAVQLMAIQEHPYYGSFGYQVSNFFAPSSRFGTPDELKHLIDVAHGLGLRVLLDLVHSHAVKNTHEGLNEFDGTDHQYFHAGSRGHHPLWDSKLFDYGKYEVQRFLLSNCRYWLEEFRFDGFRFDGITSMIYRDHGMFRVFTSYDDYFGDNVDKDAVVYLQLANQLIRGLERELITIAEDVSGMVGMARSVDDGGLGFDYRLAMSVPDYWIKTLKERKDEDWDLAELYHVLLNRRVGEKHVGYAESHDQALVGDKTLAFLMMDAEMYWRMANHAHSGVIDRGIALHKLIRLISFSLAGEAYLTFMGNEFGHPEWIDFPREGNQFSYQYARRQWSLVDDEELRYASLNRFDAAMLQLDQRFDLLDDPFIEQLWIHEHNKQLVYRRGPLVFAFNWHPSQSYSDWRIPVPDETDYQIVLDADEQAFAGHGRTAPGQVYPLQKEPFAGRAQSIQVYVPARSAQVLAPAASAKKRGR